MGQKVHPVGFRLGINKLWESSWFNLKKMPAFIAEDAKIRKFIRTRVGNADISKINIERMGEMGEMLRITIHAGKPGVVIGKGGGEVENLKSELDDMTGVRVTLNIEHIKRSGIDAYLIAKNIAVALEKKMKFRNIMKRAISRTIAEGVKGIKISISGRLNAAEIARTEWMKEGRVPLQTIRADIDYGFCEAMTTYGNIGVKVWVYHGEIVPKKNNA